MSRKDTLRRIDQGIAATGGASVSITLSGSGSSGGASNADTVDGYHASSTATAGKLLALDASAQFNPSVIDWADVAGAGLDDAGDTLVVLYGATATTIAPDDSANPGSNSTASRSDHVHAIAAAAASTLTVTTANAEGNATSFARSNHTHAITSSANPGAAASILASTSDGYLQLVRLGLGIAPTVALQVQGTTPQLRIQSDNSNYVTFGAGATGNLTITPSGNSILLPAAKTLSSDNWASQTTGWGIYQEPTHSRAGYADFRYIYADELHVKAFIADLEQALAGGQIIAKSVAILSQDYTIPAKGAASTLKVQDLPGTTAAVFATGDWIRLRTITRHATTGALVVADAYGTVGAATLNGDGTQQYTYSRPADDAGTADGTVVPKGGLAIDYGTSGAGFWEVTTLDTAGSPYAQVVTWATHPQTQTVRVRLGNLDGIAGIGAEWGLWAGKDATHYIKLTDSAAVLQGIAQTWIDSGGDARGAVDPTAAAGDYLFWLGPSSGDKRFGVTGAGTVYIGNVPSSNVAGWAYAGDLTKIDGGDVQARTITAASMAVVNANLVSDWSFEYGGAGWTLATGGSVGAAAAVTGSYRLNGDGNRAEAYAYATQTVPVQSSAMYYGEVWAFVSTGSRATGMAVRWLDASDAVISTSFVTGTATGGYQKFTLLMTAPSNAVTARLDLAQWGAASDSPPRYDDVIFRAASGNNLVVGTPGAARVEVNNSGIEGYSDASTKQFYLRTSDGRGMFGAGKGVLDASGVMLSGSETSYQTYNAVRWLDGTLPAGDEVARVSAGLFVRNNGDTADRPALRIVVDAGAGYAGGELELSNEPLTASTRQSLLMFNRTQTTDIFGGIQPGIRLKAVDTVDATDMSASLELLSGTVAEIGGTAASAVVRLGTTNVISAAKYTGTASLAINSSVAYSAGATLTIASGVITVTHVHHVVDTEGAAATDDLVTINGYDNGRILILHSATYLRVVTLKDGTGNLKLAGDFALGDTTDSIVLMYWNSNWNELCRSNN